MPTTIDSVVIERIAIIDDDGPVRDSYEPTVEDLGLRPMPESGPLGDMKTCIEVVRAKADAALCDHHLILLGHKNSLDLSCRILKSYDAETG